MNLFFFETVLRTSESELNTFRVFVTEDKSKLQFRTRQHPNCKEFLNNPHIAGVEIKLHSAFLEGFDIFCLQCRSGDEEERQED